MIFFSALSCFRLLSNYYEVTRHIITVAERGKRYFKTTIIKSAITTRGSRNRSSTFRLLLILTRFSFLWTIQDRYFSSCYMRTRALTHFWLQFHSCLCYRVLQSFAKNNYPCCKKTIYVSLEVYWLCSVLVFLIKNKKKTKISKLK